MKSLLVPVNFKACAINAAHYAADMALALEADLHLLHVLEIPAGTTSTPLPYIMDEMRRNAEWLLRQLSEDLDRRTRGQVTIVTHIELGRVEAKIEAYGAGIQPFLVIMGAPEPPHEKFFDGSETVTAVGHLPYPLLVIPDKQQFHAIRTIALACQVQDLKEGIPVSLAFFRELKEIFGARFEVVHFTTGRPGDERDIIELYHWKQTLGEIMPELHFVQAENLEDGIVQYLASHPTDWLMIFPKKHHFLEFHKSRSKRIVMHCPVPLLSICEQAHTPAPKEKKIV